MKTWSDFVAMLLSADWFHPYWSLTGLWVPTNRQEPLKKALGEVVMDFVPSDGVYWNASFTDQRIHLTKEALLNLLTKHRAEGSLLARIEESGVAASSSSDEAWLLLSISELIVAGELPNSLPNDFLQRLRDLWLMDERVDFETLCLKSNSKWDVFLRSLTPGQPSYMSDFFIHDFMGKDRFSDFWAKVCAHTSQQERAPLVEFYESTARDLTGQEVSFSIRG